MAPVRQAAVAAQDFQAGLTRYASGFGDGECGKRIGEVVTPAKRELPRGHEQNITAGEPLLTISCDYAIAARIRRIQPETQLAADRRGRTCQRIGTVEHRDAAAAENALLRGRVCVHAGIAVEVVWRDVEDRGDVGAEVQHDIELEARELEHIKHGIGVQQLERGHAEVAATAAANT